jgi:hypothetical protein
MPHPLLPFSRFLSGSRARKAAALLALACGLGTVQAQDVYVNGTVGGAIAPGVYGQITFGSQPPPPVLYAQPVLVQRGPMAQPPLYLYVPPGHSKNWNRFCGRYNACGRPVYFVQVNERNRWWANPHGGPGPDNDRRDDRGDGPRQGRGHDDDRGHGHGRGPKQFDH